MLQVQCAGLAIVARLASEGRKHRQLHCAGDFLPGTVKLQREVCDRARKPCGPGSTHSRTHCSSPGVRGFALAARSVLPQCDLPELSDAVPPACALPAQVSFSAFSDPKVHVNELRWHTRVCASCMQRAAETMSKPCRHAP
mmetsp:Transcript_149658/g.363495  ORF Transcript_149658/g.363495 Transcript_149658/m.363495 type:complete len:141 (+) Transcript_149658:646-1068(+)